MYNKLAQAYYESRKNMTGTSYFYNELLEMPAMIRMLGDLKDKKVLDIGCGPGIYIEKIKDSTTIYIKPGNTSTFYEHRLVVGIGAIYPAQGCHIDFRMPINETSIPSGKAIPRL